MVPWRRFIFLVVLITAALMVWQTAGREDQRMLLRRPAGSAFIFAMTFMLHQHFLIQCYSPDLTHIHSCILFSVIDNLQRQADFHILSSTFERY